MLVGGFECGLLQHLTIDSLYSYPPHNPPLPKMYINNVSAKVDACREVFAHSFSPLRTTQSRKNERKKERKEERRKEGSKQGRKEERKKERNTEKNETHTSIQFWGRSQSKQNNMNQKTEKEFRIAGSLVDASKQYMVTDI